jgi:hypothetical protein
LAKQGPNPATLRPFLGLSFKVPTCGSLPKKSRKGQDGGKQVWPLYRHLAQKLAISRRREYRDVAGWIIEAALPGSLLALEGAPHLSLKLGPQELANIAKLGEGMEFNVPERRNGAYLARNLERERRSSRIGSEDREFADSLLEQRGFELMVPS